ncbi:hypothetical protein BDR26DRAFT_878268 [Obelidium mucronatum]|nr:hypothetical protein BDR26DRAFT_878268 [Obelidium mucronatum]
MSRTIPRDVYFQILIWIHPRDIPKYLQLCRSVYEVVTSYAFAMSNLSNFIGQNQLGTLQAPYNLDHLDLNWFEWLDMHQQVYCDRFLDQKKLHRLTDIVWRHSKHRSNGRITGGFAHIVNMNRLKDLYLSQPSQHLPICKISIFATIASNGIIPAELGDCMHLQQLDLSGNKFCGAIPDSFSKLSKLFRLNLGHNELSGELPESMGNLSALWSLDLAHNQLTGPIPESFSRLTKLGSLRLSNNRLTNELPRFLFTQLPELTQFEAANNQFSGELPIDTRTRPWNLQWKHFSIENNSISGNLPDWLFGTCQTLNLGQCHFSVPIPLSRIDSLIAERSYHDQLTFLSLSGIQLNDAPFPVTRFFDHLCIEHLDLSGCGFSGPLPPTLPGKVPWNIQFLDLSDNKLDGDLPLWFKDMTKLKVLRLRGNRFVGVVPREFGEMVSLREWDLSGNPGLENVKADRLGGRKKNTVVYEIAGCRRVKWC